MVEESKVALITGVGGQDGSYLSEFLLSKGYIVHGLLRHCSVNNKQRITHLEGNDNFHLHYGDITQSLSGLILKTAPDEIYNLAGQSFVKASFDIPQYTCKVNAMGVLELLESIKNINPKIRMYQASTSEIYGDSEPPQNEDTAFRPRSPYAVAKLFSYWMVRNYREAYGMFVTNGILFNHESPRRGDCFVTKKVCEGVSNIVNGKQDHIELGNLNAKRDWGHSKDFVECMWKILQEDKPDDYVISTGQSKTVKELVEVAFKRVGKAITWEGEGEDEVGLDQDGIVRIKVNPIYFRPTEVEALQGNSTKAQNELLWTPTVLFEDMIGEMIDAELEKFV